MDWAPRNQFEEYVSDLKWRPTRIGRGTPDKRPPTPRLRRGLAVALRARRKRVGEFEAPATSIARTSAASEPRERSGAQGSPRASVWGSSRGASPSIEMARPEGLEPPAYRFEACRSI